MRRHRDTAVQAAGTTAGYAALSVMGPGRIATRALGSRAGPTEMSTRGAGPSDGGFGATLRGEGMQASRRCNHPALRGASAQDSGVFLSIPALVPSLMCSVPHWQ